MKDNIAIKISGPAGTGVMQAGETLSKALNQLGFFTLVYPEYPSRIRGGDNNVQVVFASENINCVPQKSNVLMVLAKENLKLHQKNVTDRKNIFDAEALGLRQIAQQLGKEILINSAALGYLWKTLGLPICDLEEQLKIDFQNEQIFYLNLKAAEAGYLKGQATFNLSNKKISAKPINFTGNEALTAGLLAGGLEFAAIYPMTPINSILAVLANEKKVVLFRPEDEIAGILAAVGAGYAGKRSLTATSGGGFSLMTEGLGLAGMAEIPLVIILGQRTGPSSGMATYSSQADLNFAVNAGHGEFPRIVLTPGDLPELYRLGIESFDLAERYRVPVILMTDKYLAESRFSNLASELSNKLAEKGKTVKRRLPGQGDIVLANSYEHDEFGLTDDGSLNRKLMMTKRMGKLNKLSGGYSFYQKKIKKGKTLLVGWGSTKGFLREAVEKYPDKFDQLHFWRVWPFPKETGAIFHKYAKIVVVENNYSGQLAGLIEKELYIKVDRFNKDDGRPFFSEELEKII